MPYVPLVLVCEAFALDINVSECFDRAMLHNGIFTNFRESNPDQLLGRQLC